ncbi:hypothetical protein NQ317_016810 [Molorchus minor]|uniref:Uncharacterized protein n=2 Tax=Molorchus minor TaxID=1323400 RepID=A0ABQ9JGU7_9CUCU|nr:hypothetical protein NQ317_016810 [Molorchus minor]
MTKKFLPRNRTNKDILKTDAKRRVCVVTPEIRSKIVNFFEKDEVSRMCPGKRDFIRRGATKNQKRILLNTVKDLHPKFMRDTGIKLSYMTLLREKPFWVVNLTAKDRDTCLCVRHENFAFIVNKLYRVNQVNFGNVSKLIKDVSCDETSYDCMFSLCDKCKEIPMTASENGEDSTNYFQWQSSTEERLIRGEKRTVKIVKKVLVTSTIKELKSKLIEEIPAMKKHIYGSKGIYRQVRKAYIDRFERHISTGSKGIYRQVRKAYIDRSYVLNNCHHFPQIAKRVTAYPLQQFFPSGKMRGRRPRRWQRSCHRGGEAARGVGAADPASLAELGN